MPRAATPPRRIARERKTIRTMIGMYCRHHHGGSELCTECGALWAYAQKRLEKCPYGDEKPTCVNCPIHCYQAEMREKVREVMRFAGPRMLLSHPVLALFHVVDGKKPAPERPKGKRQPSST